MFSPRPYQRRGIADIRVSLRTAQSTLYVLPTGGGKTVCFAIIAKGAAEKRNHVLVLVHRKEILRQTLKSLHGLGVTCGQIAPSRPMTDDLVQVGMVQTVVKRLAAMRRPDIIITDEAHHVLEDNSYGTIMRYWRDALRIGFTATPERLDGRGLGESFERMILGPSIRELVEDGYLARPALYKAPDNLLPSYHLTRGDFDLDEQEEAMDTRTRRGRQIVGDVIDHYRRHLDHLPAVCFCVSIRHSHLMAREFCAAGYKAVAVWGNMPPEERDTAILGLADGSVDVVCSCDVISEGVDVPVMIGAIQLRRTASLALDLQQAGRPLRPLYAPGSDLGAREGRLAAIAAGPKPEAIILDHAGNYQIHGHVLEDRAWSLSAASRRERGEKPPTTTECPKCGGVWPGRPRTCPECGFDFGDVPEAPEALREVKVIAGELEKAGAPGSLDLASIYGRAMKKDPAERARMLARRGMELLRSRAWTDESPTAAAWRSRGGRP